MSLLSPHGYQLAWKDNGPYLTRDRCPQEGSSHYDCGLSWTTIPGFPKGRIEVRPERPHEKGTAWRYQINLGEGVEIEGYGLSGSVSTQHAMVHRIPHLTKGKPWVKCAIEILPDGWKATLRLGNKERVLQGAPEGNMKVAVLLASKACFEALKRPVLLKISEPSGALQRLYEGGLWPGTGGEIGSLMSVVESLSLPHFVRLEGRS